MLSKRLELLLPSPKVSQSSLQDGQVQKDVLASGLDAAHALLADRLGRLLDQVGVCRQRRHCSRRDATVVAFLRKAERRHSGRGCCRSRASLGKEQREGRRRIGRSTLPQRPTAAATATLARTADRGGMTREMRVGVARRSRAVALHQRRLPMHRRRFQSLDHVLHRLSTAASWWAGGEIEIVERLVGRQQG